MASGDLFVYVGFVFVAHIRFQVEAYMYAQIKSTNKQIEYGHFVMCAGTFVKSNHLFLPQIHIRQCAKLENLLREP